MPSEFSRRIIENRAFRAFMKYVLLIVLLVAMVFFVFTTGGKFLSLGIIQQILISSSSLGVLSIGFAFPLISGKIDLTPGAMAQFTATVGAWLVGYQATASGLHLDPYLGLVIAILMGCLLGLIVGLLVNKLKLSDFMTTLALLIALTGLSTRLTARQPLYDYPAAYNSLGKATVFGVPIQLIIVLLFVIVTYFVMKRTTFGAHVYLSGDNEKAARAMGVNVDRIRIICFIISGFAAAVGGLMIVGRVGSIHLDMGQNLIFLIFAATMVGGVTLRGGTGISTGIWLGAVLFTALRVGLDFTGISEPMTEFFTGFILICVIAVDVLKGRWRI